MSFAPNYGCVVDFSLSFSKGSPSSSLLFGEKTDGGPWALGLEASLGNFVNQAKKEGETVQLGGGTNNGVDLLRLPAASSEELRTLLRRELQWDTGLVERGAQLPGQ